MTRFREPVSGFLHLGGAIAALLGTLELAITTWHSPAKMASLIVYGGSLILMFSASTTLHLARGSVQTLERLNRLDHASIYVLIAGTYTAFCYNLLGGTERWVMLCLIWALAVAGVIYKLCFARHPRHLSTFFYVVMGWLAVIGAPTFLSILPLGAIGLIAAGGIVYSLGAIIFALEKPNVHRFLGYHEIWHLFVLAGSALEFLAVVRYVV